MMQLSIFGAVKSLSEVREILKYRLIKLLYLFLAYNL